jgi:hypothetical protein
VRDTERFDITNDPLRSKIFTFYTNFKPGIELLDPAPGNVLKPGGRPLHPVAARDRPGPGIRPIRAGRAVPRLLLRHPCPDLLGVRQSGSEQGWQDPVRGFYVPVVGCELPVHVADFARYRRPG